MPKLQALPKDALSEGQSSPGIKRHLAFQGDGFKVVRSHGQPGAISGWHHHGDYEVYGYLVSGSARFESGPDGADAISIGPRDFFYVPPHTVHREINPSPNEDQEFILFIRGMGPMVVNVDGPEQA